MTNTLTSQAPSETVHATNEALSTTEYREKITAVEKRMRALPGVMIGNSAPLEHTFAQGMYVRKIIMPPGYIVVTKIHKFSHPAFILKGTLTIIEEGGARTVSAPAQFITPAGTKRLVICHDEVVWVTVHLNETEERDTDKLEDMLTAKTFEEFDGSIEALEE
jgi:quercetin dioxygenase-like cupin family protein